MKRLTLVLLLLAAAPAAWGQSVTRDDFEGPETSMREAGADASHRIDDHRRVQQVAHTGSWSERISLRGQNGTFVYFSHPVGPARVISELAPSIWVKADRPGVQLLVQVTLPHTRNARDSRAATTLVRGSGYTKVGSWQQLSVENLPGRLEEQVRVMRLETGGTVDAREAYVDRILVNVYGGPDVTNVWLDDLEVAGVVPPGPANQPVAATSSEPPHMMIRDLPLAWSGGQGVPSVALEGSVLVVGGQPFFPRIVDYRGERLARLQSMGFNGVRVRQVPPPELLREAARVGMWIVAPPPSLAEVQALREAGGGSLPAIFDPVLAWDLGSGLAARELETTRNWARSLAAADPRRRPIFTAAAADLRAYTRPPMNLYLAQRAPLGTSLSLGAYANWLRERGQLVLPGTPLWVGIQTAPAPQLVEQIRLLGAAAPERVVFDESQVRMLVRSALAAGARGLCFDSPSRLDAEDAATRQRAAVLELLNLELALVERWPAAGRFAAGADSNERHTTGAVIETDRSRLLLPIHAPANSQFAQGNPIEKVLAMRLSGVPEEARAFELTPSLLRPLLPRRVAGGTQVALSELERDSLVVFTQDEVILRNLKGRVEESAARAAKVARALATARLEQIDFAEDRLSDMGRTLASTRVWRAAAEDGLRQCDALIQSQNHRLAFEKARGALAALRDIERVHWEQAASGSEWPLADPLLAHLTTLADHHRVAQQIAIAPRSANLLAEGGFENYQALLAAGWVHHLYPTTQVEATVELSPMAAHSGQSGLRLRAAPSNPNGVPGTVETPPRWVTSAGVPVAAGQMVQIEGWIRVVQPITGSVDGLLIIDSLSGEALAQRVTAGSEWQQFTLYRVAPQAGTMTVTFAMTGYGEVHLDDISIQLIDRASRPSQPLSSVQPAANRGS